MSKEKIRQIAVKRFAEWQGLPDERKSYPNRPESTQPKYGRWAKLYIEHVSHKITSIGSQPCTSRVGSIVIEVYERLDEGTRQITELTDSLEQHFNFYTEDEMVFGVANTIDEENKDKSYYLSTVYIPFRYN